MDDSNMTMEEYIKIEEEKARRRGRVFNWQTATYGKIRIDDDLHELSSMEAELPAIIINDAFAPQDALYPQHIDNFNFETSLSEYDEEEQNIMYFNDLFPFNVIHPNDLKLDEDNNNNEIDIIQSSEDMALPPREQRHPFLRYEGLQYTKADIEDFEMRLTRIYRREVHRVQVFNFGGLPDFMAEGLSARMLMEQPDDQGVSLFTSRAWRRLFDIKDLLVHKLILEFYSTFRFGQAILDLDTPGALQFQLGGARRRMSWREFILALGLHTDEEMQTAGFDAYWAGSARQIPDKGDLRDYWMGISSAGDFLSTAPSYTGIWDPVLRLYHRLIACSIAERSQALEKVTVTDLFYLRGMDVDSVNHLYLLARYLRLFTAGRKSKAHISRGQFICAQFDDTWAWVAMGLERQPDAAAGAPAVAEDAPAVDEGDQAISALEDVYEIHGALTEQHEVIDAMARDFSIFSTWVVTGLRRMMDMAGVTYIPYSQTHVPYQRRVRRRTDKASTSAA
ncbi:hypothetical protein Tco_1194649 [Tanacetum coccineum]